MNKYNVDDVIIYREGLCACSVCVPVDMPAEEIERLIPSSGIKSQWKCLRTQPSLEVSQTPARATRCRCVASTSSWSAR